MSFTFELAGVPALEIWPVVMVFILSSLLDSSFPFLPFPFLENYHWKIVGNPCPEELWLGDSWFYHSWHPGGSSVVGVALWGVPRSSRPISCMSDCRGHASDILHAEQWFSCTANPFLHLIPKSTRDVLLLLPTSLSVEWGSENSRI